jgi:hypothetical protein
MYALGIRLGYTVFHSDMPDMSVQGLIQERPPHRQLPDRAGRPEVLRTTLFQVLLECGDLWSYRNAKPTSLRGLHRGDQGGSKVARWVLGCSDCNQEFTHSEIDTEHQSMLLDPFALIGDKPELPDAGVSLQCPNCKNVTVYKRHQLVYRAT